MDVKTSDGWIRSSYSGGQGNCLDHKIVTNDRGQREVWVRDSKDPSKNLVINVGGWVRFVASAPTMETDVG
jgi:hypothetical protein